MSESINRADNVQEMSDEALESVVGGYSPGDRVVYKDYKMCPTCLASIPSVTLQIYRGLDPNSQRAWIVKTDCCGTTYTCTENEVNRL